MGNRRVCLELGGVREAAKECQLIKTLGQIRFQLWINFMQRKKFVLFFLGGGEWRVCLFACVRMCICLVCVCLCDLFICISRLFLSSSFFLPFCFLFTSFWPSSPSPPHKKKLSPTHERKTCTCRRHCQEWACHLLLLWRGGDGRVTYGIRPLATHTIKSLPSAAIRKESIIKWWGDSGLLRDMSLLMFLEMHE